MLHIRIPAKVVRAWWTGLDDHKTYDSLLKIFKDGEGPVTLPSLAKLYHRKRGGSYDWVIGGYAHDGRDTKESALSMLNAYYRALGLKTSELSQGAMSQEAVDHEVKLAESIHNLAKNRQQQELWQ